MADEYGYSTIVDLINQDSAQRAAMPNAVEKIQGGLGRVRKNTMENTAMALKALEVFAKLKGGGMGGFGGGMGGGA